MGEEGRAAKAPGASHGHMGVKGEIVRRIGRAVMAAMSEWKCIRMFETNWHGGKGGKDRMKSEAASIEPPAQCMVQLQDPDSGARRFGCYATWDDALKRLRRLRGQRNHLFEVIGHGRPCKPYLDVDGPPLGVPGGRFGSVDEVVERLERLVAGVFSSDYGVDLEPEEMIWLVSPSSKKLSLHLVISTRHPTMRVYTSNHKADPTGASHLALRIRELDPEGVGPMVDASVYTKDREMRAIGASKFGADAGTALVPRRPLAPWQSPSDALITCFGGGGTVEPLDVPMRVPRVVRVRRRELVSPLEAVERDEDDERSAIVVRMLDLLRERLHPSAYHDRREAADPKDPAVGIKFNHSDRREACYSGRVHDGVQNLRCYVDAGGCVHAKCMSEHCQSQAPLRLGPMKSEADVWRSEAILVDVPYLSLADPSSPTAAAAERWLSGSCRAFSVRSPMGTGKSTMLDELFGRLPPAATILMVTYRQSLAMEHVRKLRRHGFVSYLDFRTEGEREALADRRRCPRVICQVESLWRLSGVRTIPMFDVVVMDESESLLRHFASPTVPAPVQAADAFMRMAQAAVRGVVTLDAAWGPLTWSVLRKAGMSNALVVNVRPPATTRHFSFSTDAPEWMREIETDLGDGLNVVVVSLSAERAMAVHQLGERVEGCEGRCLLHTSKTGDDVKHRLTDVESLWGSMRLVTYSPTIAASVDFSSDHFDRMYLYVCAMSAPAATALQMTGRVRRIRDPRVRCLLAQNVRPSKEASRPPMVSADMEAWLTWLSRRRDAEKLPSTWQAQALLGEPRRVSSSSPALTQLTLTDAWRPPRPETALLPPVTYWSLITSFVEAERYNAQADYLSCYSDLAEAAGHTVTIDRIVSQSSVMPPAEPGGITASKMLAAAPIEDAEEHERLRAKVADHTATEDDKWRLYVASYKAGWGVDRIDGEFLEQNRVQSGSPQARLLARLLCPALRGTAEHAGLADRTGVFKVVLIEETIEALGLRSPFDAETVVPDLMAAFEQRLRHTPMFRDYNNNARLFRQGPAGQVGGWDLKKVSKAVNMVLGAVGIKLRQPKAKRPNKKAGESRRPPRSNGNYRLDAALVRRMVELVKLRLRATGHYVGNAHAREALEACEYPMYGHLIDRERDGLLPVGFSFMDDE